MNILQEETDTFMNICLAFDEKYAEPACVLITSILWNSADSDSFSFFIFDGGITDRSKKKVERLKKIKDFRLKFINVSQDTFGDFPTTPGTHFALVNYYRLLIPSVLPEIDKALYLDTDIIVEKSLAELYETDITDFFLGGVVSKTSENNKKRLGLPASSSYINSGVLLFNIKKWRNSDIENELFRFIRESNPELLLNMDQDAINSVLYDSIFYLDLKWNVEIRTDIGHPRIDDDLLHEAHVIHYISSDKPWMENTKQDVTLYNHYRKITNEYVLPKNNYDLDFIEEITVNRFDFNLFSAPDYSWKYTEIVFEEMSALLIRQLAKGAGTFIDVGAHYGFYSVLVGKSNPDTKIYAFEPIPENFEVLRRNLDLNNISADIAMQTVSNVEGTFNFQVSEQSSQSGFIANPDEKIIKTIEVESVSLDHHFPSSLEGSILVKIDTEGHEFKVLQGMEKFIQNNNVSLLIKFNPNCLQVNDIDPQAFLEYIDYIGFDIFVVQDVEMKYIKFMESSTWQSITGERTYRNLYCVKKEKSLNLCFFSHSSGLAGAERSLLELVASLISHFGSICTVILPYEGPSKDYLLNVGASVIICPYHQWVSDTEYSRTQVDQSVETSLTNIKHLFPDLNSINPDVIISNTIVVPWGAYIANLLNTPHIWWIKEFGILDHQFRFFYTFREILDVVFYASDYIVVASEAVYRQFYSALPAEKCSVAYNLVTPPNEVSNDRTFYTYSKALKLIISGSLIYTKGQDDAVNAVLKLTELGYDVELSILGDTRTPFAQKLIEFVKEAKIDNRIHFWGSMDNIWPILTQSDVALVCSKNEAFGRVTAEAMLLSKPVIGTNTGGTAELVQDGYSGLLYTPENVDELVNKIIYFVENKEKVREFGENAREEIEKKLKERPVDKIIYQKAIDLKNSLNLMVENNYILNSFSRRYILQNISQENKLQEMDAHLKAQVQTIQTCSEQATERGQIIRTLDEQVARQEKTIQMLNEQATERDQTIQTLNKQVAEQGQTIQILNEQATERKQTIQSLNEQATERNQEIVGYLLSKSWRITRPFRKIGKAIRRQK